MDPILGIIDKALKEKGLSDSAASKLAVGHPSLIKNLRMPRDTEKRYNLPSLMKLADVLDLEFYFGPKRQHSGAPTLGNMDPDEDAPSGFATIPLVSDAPGSSTAPVAFSRAWLDRHQLVPHFLKAVMPDRFDVDPPPGPGSIALVTTATSKREGTALWSFREAGRIVVANMTFVEDIAVVHPASQDSEAKVYRGRSSLLLGLVGKVVWIGQSIPLKGKVG